VSLLSELMRDLHGELSLYVVRAGLAIDQRSLTVLDDWDKCIKDLEASDKRLPCSCHYEWEDSIGD
jgi:hypothetical protein